MNKINKLKISVKDFEALKFEVDKAWPIEACALLVGKIHNDVAIVHKVVIVKNVDNSQFTFSIKPEDLLQIYLDAERNGLDVIGVFHSHPTQPQPSIKDLEFMRVNPIVWLIIAKPSGNYGAFQWVENSIKRVEIDLVKSEDEP